MLPVVTERPLQLLLGEEPLVAEELAESFARHALPAEKYTHFAPRATDENGFLAGQPPCYSSAREPPKEAAVRPCLLLLFTLPGCCLLSPAPPPLLSELDWSTPTAAVATFRRAFQAGKVEYEYLCLSQALREREGLSFTVYQLGRDRFLAANRPLLRELLEAEVVAVRPLPEGPPPRTLVRVARGPHVADFVLVNEPVCWVRYRENGDTLTVDLPLRSLTDVVHTRGRRLEIRDLPAAGVALPPAASIVKIQITDRWRLLDIAGLSLSLQEAIRRVREGGKGP